MDGSAEVQVINNNVDTVAVAARVGKQLFLIVKTAGTLR